MEVATNLEPVVSSSSTTTSAAELRRQARRKKILENQGDRYKRILGPGTSDEEIAKLVKTSSSIDDSLSQLSSTVSSFSSSLNLNEAITTATSVLSSTTIPTTITADIDELELEPEVHVQQQQRVILGRTNIFPNISPKEQRYLTCVLAVMLSTIIYSSTFNCFFIYFILWELSIWFFVKKPQLEANNNPNSGTNPQINSNDNIPLALTLLPLLGLHPSIVAYIKTLYRLWNWLWIDFCCFITSILISQMIISNVLIYIF